LHVFDHIFLKTSKLPNKKGTFDVNLVFTATLACTKRALFITKKGGTCPPRFLRPWACNPLDLENESWRDASEDRLITTEQPLVYNRELRDLVLVIINVSSVVLT
jgi:hypothetical protein